MSDAEKKAPEPQDEPERDLDLTDEEMEDAAGGMRLPPNEPPPPPPMPG